MKTYQNIEFEITDSIGTVWLNRPDKHNALNAEMIAEIIECFEELNNNQEVRIVMLRGRGKSFCAGADLNYMKGKVLYFTLYSSISGQKSMVQLPSSNFPFLL